MSIRLVKTLLAASAGVLILLVGINNLFDYQTNYEVVRHILSMDMIPDDSPLKWRAMTSPALHHAAYWFIILAELVSAFLTLRGALAMRGALRAEAPAFEAAKHWAIVGLAAGFSLYFFGFMVVGGEWFQMWRAGVWNMQEPAFRFIGAVGLVMLIVLQRESDDSA